MAIIATAATAPPTMGPVFELLLREDEDVGEIGGDVVEAGKPVAGGAWVVLPARAEEVLEAPINSPGPISGLSPADIDLFAFQPFSSVMSRVDQ